MEKCGECGSLGYRINKGKFFAHARVCECKTDCRECGGQGFVVSRGNDGYRYKIPCKKCAAVYANIKKYNNAQIPALMAFAEVKPRTQNKGALLAVEYIRRFINSYPMEKGFVLTGAPGRGKTFLAAATVAEQTLRQGIECLFQDFNDLIYKIHRGRDEGISEHFVLEPLFKTELLVLDGVGLGGRELTAWEKSVLENIISQRYGANGKLILTTSKHNKNNLGESDFQTEIGDQSFSRLSRMCQFLSLD